MLGVLAGGGALTQVNIGAAAHFKTKPSLLVQYAVNFWAAYMCADLSKIHYHVL